jgi:hypothetical protein
VLTALLAGFALANIALDFAWRTDPRTTKETRP